MRQQGVLSYEQKHQALLDHFLPYRKQNSSCARIVAYLQSPMCKEGKVLKMRYKLDEIRKNRWEKSFIQSQEINEIRKIQGSIDAREAEEILADITE